MGRISTTKAPRGVEVRINDMMGQLKAIKVEDGDLVVLRMASDYCHDDLGKAQNVLRKAIDSLGLKVASLVMPADCDIEKIPRETAERIFGKPWTSL